MDSSIIEGKPPGGLGRANPPQNMSIIKDGLHAHHILQTGIGKTLKFAKWKTYLDDYTKISNPPTNQEATRSRDCKFEHAKKNASIQKPARKETAMPEFILKQDRKRVENFHKGSEDIIFAEVSIDLAKCKGCKFCAKACAASALEIVDKKCRMLQVLPMCMGCGDCIAICPENAIDLVKVIEFHHFFRFVDRGEPAWPRRF